MIRIFIGDTLGAPVLFNVLQASIHRRSSQPVSITPLALSQLHAVYDRPRDPMQSTDFSFSRFLVPHLCDYSGWALFMDNDMLMLDDVARLWALRDERYAVMCVKHLHDALEQTKLNGRAQTRYQRKNWSSLMLLNCGRCTALTPAFVATASGLALHQFHWLANAELIGRLPAQWNHLVSVDPANAGASNVHFTLGGPYLSGYEDVEHAAEWLAERERLQLHDQR